MGIMDLLSQFGMTDSGDGMSLPGGTFNPQQQQQDSAIPMPDQKPGLDPASGGMIPMPPPRPDGAGPGNSGQGGGFSLFPQDQGGTGGDIAGASGIPAPQGGPAAPATMSPADQASAMASAGGPGLPPAPPAPAEAPAPAPVPLPPPRPLAAPQGQQIPIPQPRPQMPGGSPALPPGAQPAAGVGTPGGAPPGPPMSLAAPGQQPPLPPFAQNGQRPQPEMQVLRSDDKKMRQFGSGVAAGLSQIKGPGKFASFARGAGQGLQGSEKEQQRQEGTEDKQQGTHFNQLSTAFKDMLAAQNAGNAGALNKARADYFTARAKAEGQGSKAWQNTPQGKIMNIEKTIDARADRALKLKAQQWKQNGTPEAQQKAEEQALRQQMETEKQGLYRQMGINPGDVEKIKSEGLSPQTPFDASKMTPEQFHSTVPMDSYYRAQDGKVYQRTQPPPGDKKAEADDKAATDYAAATEGPDVSAMTGANG